MAKKCKNCKCNKKVVIPPTPCFTSAGCPPKPACEDTFDIDCVNYTGEPIVCNGEVLVESGESLPTVLTTLVDKICNKINCELDVQFIFNAGTSELNFTITGGTESYTIKPSVVQGPFTGITLDDCETYATDGPNNCYIPVYNSALGFTLPISCVPNKFYVGNGSNKYAGTVRIELVDPFGCSHDFFYTVVIDEEDCTSLV
jgi:hypothetical protein